MIIQQVFYVISLFMGTLVLIGMIRPWIVLWWLDHQNRLKVLKYYGSIAIISLLLARFL